MNIKETIKKRRSCRSFNQEKLSSEIKGVLEDYIHENGKLPVNEFINLYIIEKLITDGKMKLDYGMIRGHHTYILGTSTNSKYSRVNYGYLMEKAVLKATEIGLSSCWVGYFDDAYFNEIIVADGCEIPSIVIIGYPQNGQDYLNKFMRFTQSSSKRLSWDQLFFNYNTNKPLVPEQLNKYSDSIEMVRLAPSSGNTQPWRDLFDEKANEFHFFKKSINKKYEEKGLHDVDMGIAIAHFELTSVENGLPGSWIINAKDKMNSFEDLEYIISWKCE